MDKYPNKPSWRLRIQAPRQTVAEKLPQLLKSEWGLDTLPNSKGLVVSKTSEPSLGKYFLNAIPSHITWELEEEGANTTLLTCIFDCPISLLLQVYILAAFYGFIAYIPQEWLLNVAAVTRAPSLLLSFLVVTLLNILVGLFFVKRTWDCLRPPIGKLSRLLSKERTLVPYNNASSAVHVMTSYVPARQVFVSTLHGAAVLLLASGQILFKCVPPDFLYRPFAWSVVPLLIAMVGCFLTMFLLHLAENEKANRFQTLVLVMPSAQTALNGLFLAMVIFLFALPALAGSAMLTLIIKTFMASAIFIGLLYMFNIYANLYLYWDKRFQEDIAYHCSDFPRRFSEHTPSLTALSQEHALLGVLICILCALLNWLVLFLLALISLSSLMASPVWPLGYPAVLPASFLMFDANAPVTVSSGPDAFESLHGGRALALAVFAITPGLILLVGNIHWFVSWCNRLRPKNNAKGALKEITERVSRAFQLEHVTAVIDPGMKKFGVRADIRGRPSRGFIRFSKRAAAVLEENPAHAEVVIAHELGHLKHHCPFIRKMRILSRLMLTGSGTLSFLYDSISMENKADDEAREYLKNHELEESLFCAALELFESNAAAAQSVSGTVTAAFTGCDAKQDRVRPSSGAAPGKWFFPTLTQIRRAYWLYFFEEDLFYLHPDSKTRGGATHP